MAYRFIKNIWAGLKQLSNNDIWDVVDAGAPVNGTSGTGAGFVGIGSVYINTTNGARYINTGTKASPTWSLLASGSFNPTASFVAAGTLSSGATTATTVAVSGALTTDQVMATWQAAPQTITPIIAVINPAGTLAISFATTVGTAGTVAYSVVRAQ
jgi:hypothetical protein